jgi:hypothetical protein
MSMIALSMGVERVVEIIKGMVPWLRTADPDNDKDSWRCLVLQVMAAIAGGVIAGVTGPQNFLPWLKGDSGLWGVPSCILLGLMASGGSAFWNHALDIVGAIKDTKEHLETKGNGLSPQPLRVSSLAVPATLNQPAALPQTEGR